MNDAPTPPVEAEAPAPAAQAPEPAAPTDRPEENIVAEERRKRQKAEREINQLTARLEELENRDKSELERERSKREQFERQATEASQRLERLERGGWIRSAAAAAGFDDPEDAVAFIASEDVETAADAEKAVARLAKRKPRLLRDTTPPQIGQVVQNGRQATQQQSGEQAISPEAEALLEQVKAAQAAGWTSTPVI